MQNLKLQQGFDGLTKNQKSSFFSYIKIFTKKYADYSVDDVWNKFKEEELYYFFLNNQRFLWMNDFINNPDFEKSVKMLIKTQKQSLNQKAKKKEYFEKNKDKIIKYRANARQFRQAHEKPSKKQIFYYNALCKKIGVETEDLSGKSKLDLVKMISELTDKKDFSDEL